MSSKKLYLSVQAGFLKGLVLDFPIGQFPETGVTQQKLKEAILAIANSIFPELKNNTMENPEIFFADLFAGSGQIGIEALSQGFYPVFLNELDFKKFIWLKNAIPKIYKRMKSDPDFKFIILKQKNALKLLAEPEKIFAFIDNFKVNQGIFFCDPPFIQCKGRDDLTYWKKVGFSVESFLLKIRNIQGNLKADTTQKTEFIKKRYLLFLHIPKSIDKADIIKSDELFDPYMDRIYGNHRLIVWDNSEN